MTVAEEEGVIVVSDCLSHCGFVHHQLTCYYTQLMLYAACSCPCPTYVGMVGSMPYDAATVVVHYVRMMAFSWST